MTWTVKEALEKAFSNPECIRVYLKSKKKFSDGTGEFYQIGYAETLESALRTFGGFLDLKAELDDEDQRIARVFVNGDDVIRIKVETDGVESYRFYANPKRIVPETVKESKESKMFENLKPGNLTKEDVKDLQAFVQHKDKVLDAVCWNCYNAENTLRECAEIVIELDPKRGRNLVESLKILVSVLENKVSKKLK